MAAFSAQQILIPKKVYIGDQAELRCTFNSPSTELKQLVNSESDGQAELSLVSFNSSEYEVKSVTLAPAGVDFYQLSITFIPWKTGEIQFPPFTIDGTDLLIEFQPVQIVSLISTDSNNATVLRDTAAPLLLPGTTYKIYGALTAFIIFLIAAIRIIIKRKSIQFYLNTKRLQRKYKKNKKQTFRALRQIENETSDSYIAGQIQKIMRNYLEVRFDYPFTNATTSELMKGWQKVTGGLLSDAKEEAFGDITASFIRTDYIRYGNENQFNENEKTELIKKLIDCIEVLEKEEGDEND